MQLTWTETGTEYIPPERRAKLTEVMERTPWQQVPCDMAMMPGEAIKTLCKELRLGRCIEVASMHDLAPYSLVAVHAQRKRQGIRLWAVDTGTSVTAVAHEIYNKEAEK